MNSKPGEVCSLRRTCDVYKRGAPALLDVFPKARTPIDAGSE